MEHENITVFVDTSFFKGLVDANDDFHINAKANFSYLIEHNFILITSNFVLDETYTLLRHKCGYEKAMEMRELVQNKIALTIDRVMASDEHAAWVWFEKDWSKLSFTDCVTFAQMKRLGLDTVATFDGHFRRAGFVLIGDK